MKLLDSTTQISLKNILWATDFSEESQTALPYAEAIARHYGSKIYVAHVTPPELYEFMPPVVINQAADQVRASAELQMAALLNDGRLQCPHQGLLGEGEIGDVLCDMIRRHDIDLVVLRTHGREGFTKFALGSVAEEVFRIASCPVLTIGPRVAGEPAAEVAPKRILYATDFTPDSLLGAPYAVSLAQENQARLTLLHVMDGTDTNAQLWEDFKARLLALMPLEAELWCKPEAVVAFGSPAETILKISVEQRADLIVLGVRGSGAFPQIASHWPEPTAYHVVAHAHCPVFTVHGSQK